MTKLDFSNPDRLQTRDGRQVRIYATDVGGAYPIHGAVPSPEGWALLKWTIDGRNCNSTIESRNDLVPKPRRITGWVNVYEGCLGGTVFETKEAAQTINFDYIGQIYIDAEVQE